MSAVVAAVVVAIAAFLVWHTAGGGAWRGSVSVSEALLVDADSVELTVDSCNGAPMAEIVRQDGATVEIKVVAYSTPLKGGDDCQDSVVIDLDQPVTRLIDVTSGTEFGLAG
ncbi:MAG: hypothetical protein CSA55_05005 [Ilumatobacter coccineus]|uniref:Uncharacterized protein n=1 Tax=Ilumatobacter coccineus TaxID=467094 RepID=A0A2G6K7Q3_9ACTN|nr:MAG: hypothetical protein CSA55_05005 [Ilumatobacter coccineus]